MQRRSGGTARRAGVRPGVVAAPRRDAHLARAGTARPIVLSGLGLLLADRLGRRLVGSVTALAATADRLAAGDLTARFEPGATPELRRVGLELNRLAGRIQHLLTAAREEAADLAHRLRTPVAALRLNLDTVADAGDRARLSADVDALARLVDEVIRTARRPVREGAGARRRSGRRRRRAGGLLVGAGRGRRTAGRARPARRSRCRYGRRPRTSRPRWTPCWRTCSATRRTAPRCGCEVAAGPDGGGTVTVEDAGPGLPADSGPPRRQRRRLDRPRPRHRAPHRRIVRRMPCVPAPGRLGGALVELRLARSGVTVSSRPQWRRRRRRAASMRRIGMESADRSAAAASAG